MEIQEEIKEKKQKKADGFFQKEDRLWGQFLC